jgi:hypothetical protein
MRRMMARAAAIAAVMAILLATGVQPAFAHETRTVGAYTLTVGWDNEPAYSGQPNSVGMRIRDAAGRPVVDLGDTLEVEVIFGGQTSSKMKMEPGFAVNPDGTARFGTLGAYSADLTPSRAGVYTYHFTGSIKGQAIDERFTSSETTFDSPKDISEVSFPAKDPNAAQLADRINRTSSRLSDDTDTAKILGYVGIGLGALALIAALARGRGKAAG